MKRILYTLLGMLMFQANAQSTPYEIDKQATAKAQWKTGDNISTYLISLDEGFYDIDRQFQGITLQGFYLVQDFYQKEGKPFTQPFVLNHPQAFPLDWMEFMEVDPAPLVSDYQQLHLNGAKAVEIKSTGPNRYQRTSWYSNGQLKSQIDYVSGKMDGLFTLWDVNGHKVREGNLLHGVHDGLWLSWHENGQLATSVLYKNGLRDGKWENWHENGVKFREGEYINGKASGIMPIWDENGTLIEKIEAQEH